MRKRSFTFTTARAAEVFHEMISVRRIFCADTEFFRMTDFWKDQCEGSDRWSIRTYRSTDTRGYMRPAGVIAFDDRVGLTVDESLWRKAEGGCPFSNFTLAHEVGHLALDHHAHSATTKNFKLSASSRGMANIPPTLEERETNFAAVFLQCGTALFDQRWSAVDLARRAFSDVYYVQKAQSCVQLDVFKREFYKPKKPVQRVIL
jgi:hypothetical protein